MIKPFLGLAALCMVNLTARPVQAQTLSPVGGILVTGTVQQSGAAFPAASFTLSPASLHGARIFIRYSLQYYPTTTTRFDHLMLFPSGAAFADIPTKPVTSFDEATLRPLLKPYDIGTWKQTGGTMILSFPNKSSDKMVTLHKVARGWYDGTGQPKPDGAYDVYYPVIPLTPKILAGPWMSKSLVTAGTNGGGAPMVAAGSTGNRVFYTNGTYSDARESFTSATTINMGSAFKGEGDVVSTSNRKSSETGLWRVDGPLLTLQKNNERLVCVAFVMPNWGPPSKPDVMIDGDRWKRPEKK